MISSNGIHPSLNCKTNSQLAQTSKLPRTFSQPVPNRWLLHILSASVVILTKLDDRLTINVSSVFPLHTHRHMWRWNMENTEFTTRASFKKIRGEATTQFWCWETRYKLAACLPLPPPIPASHSNLFWHLDWASKGWDPAFAGDSAVPLLVIYHFAYYWSSGAILS